ncbi:hypothetical protein SESBI_08847 [Sesbania bispinosa]|nr:hypothetical protein SESBI_08847 [Sesbania bispinosa]
MASNTTLPDSSARSLIPATLRRRKYQNSTVAVALRRRGTHKRHSGISSPVNFRESFLKSEVSARKLAAGLWQLRFVELSGDDGADIGHGSFPSSMSQLANGNVKVTFPHCDNSGDKFKETKDQIRRPVTILRSRNGLRCELETYMPCLKCSKEEATKWNPALNEASNEFKMIHSKKLLEDKKLVGDRDSVVTVLLEELLRAQRTVNKLKAAQKSSKKKVKQFLQNLEEEKIFWKRKKVQKIEAMLDGLKDKLARERRSKERMEVLNTKLIHELTVANQSAKQFMTNYEKEKKERELAEEVCNELALQIGEDRAKLEELLRDSMKIREEVEEERKMMEMAELWREERVQMKLMMQNLGAELDTEDLEDAQLIKQAVESVNIKRMVELSYDFSKSDDIFPIYEELRKDNADERMITLDSHTTHPGPLSTVHIESLDEDELNENSTLHQSSPSSDYNVIHIENQEFSSAPQRSDTYLINVNQDKNTSGSEAECSEKAGLESLKTGVIVNGVCSVSIGQSKWKVSPASKQLKSCPNDGTTISYTKSSQHRRASDGFCKPKECNWRLTTGSIQSGETTTCSSSLCKGSVEGSLRQSELLGEGNSKDNMNPHITRGMKGCIEWPRGIPKSNSKVIALEERVKSQKSQLQHILKPKAY